MDARIILAGQPVDLVGAMRQGNAAAIETNALRQNNQLTDLYRQQGAGLLAGDQGAMNALAGVDPGLAMGMRADQQTFAQNARKMEITEENLKMSYDTARQQAAEAARGMAAEERAAQAETLGRILTGAATFYAKGDQQGYTAWLEQNGADPAQYPFAQFPAHAATVKGAMDALTAFTPESQEISPNDRFKVVGGVLMDLGAEGGPKPIYEAPMQTETIFGPDGKPIVQRGGGNTKFTEAQGRDNVYSTRAEGALAKLEPVVDALASRVEMLADKVPLGLARSLQSEEYQVAKQAGDEFLQAILRKDTGAAITEQEQAMYGDTYLPRPGDGPSVLQAKREARARALSALQSGMNADQFAATERALIDAARRVESAAQPGASVTPDPATAPASPPPPPPEKIIIDGYTIEAIQ